MYKFESILVDDFSAHLEKYKNPFAVSAYAREFNYLNGKVDIIAKSKRGNLFSFEAKLRNWQKALNQAYRSTTFSHYSYVILPLSNAKKVLKYKYEFNRRGVGLCSIENSKVIIEIKASRRKPIQPWLTKSAIQFIGV